MQDISGKTAIITGASSGIGRASALALAEEGVGLVLTARSGDKLADIARQCRELGVQAVHYAGDAREESTAIATVKLAMDTFGRIDILLSNAGIGIAGPFLNSTMETYDVQMNTNVRSSYAFCLHAVPEMIKKEESQLIIVSSVTGINGHVMEVAYSATKFANRGMAQALNLEFREQGLKVCTLCPSATNTEFQVGAGRTHEGNDARLMLLPQDLADAVVFICKQSKGTSRVMEMTLASMSGD